MTVAGGRTLDASCTGKVAFLTWELAHRIIERRRKSELSKHEPQTVYRCPHCRQWHIGTRAPRPPQ